MVEVDGADHLSAEGLARDARWDAYLRSVGFEVLRVRDFEVLHDPCEVKRRIETTVKRKLRVTSPSSPIPLPEAERGEPG